jgi:endogenous inhibitor of DNA gyrase (YacG/DUF329 family)
MRCKKCGKHLTGNQKSYCSQRCSKLHLKALYNKRNPHIVQLHKMKAAQKKRLEKIQSGQLQIGDAKVDFKRHQLIHILSCSVCENRFASPRLVKYCPEHSSSSRFKKLRFDILKRDNFTCQYCGRKAPNVILHVDHIIPSSKGGTNDRANLVTACQDCNLGKRDVLLSN